MHAQGDNAPCTCNLLARSSDLLVHSHWVHTPAVNLVRSYAFTYFDYRATVGVPDDCVAAAGGWGEGGVVDEVRSSAPSAMCMK